MGFGSVGENIEALTMKRRGQIVRLKISPLRSVS